MRSSASGDLVGDARLHNGLALTELGIEILVEPASTRGVSHNIRDGSDGRPSRLDGNGFRWTAVIGQPSALAHAFNSSAHER
jgi:hypothetical protein